MAIDSTHRFHHAVPSWVSDGSAFHIRVRVAPDHRQSLTEPSLAKALLKSAAYYHEKGSWYCHLMLLMPDHWHALLSFPPASKMGVVVGRWKAWQRRTLGIGWQDNFFDHRIRNNHEYELKADYILKNPVVKDLCAKPTDWPWVLDSNSLDQRSH
jgi:putative transposase